MGQVRQVPVRTLWKPLILETLSLTATNRTYNLQGNGGQLPRDRYLSGLLLTVSFRVTTPASNGPSAVLADAPYSLINEVQVIGSHITRRSEETIVRLRGADIAQLQRLYTRKTVEGSGTLGTTANTAYDIKFVLFVPFVPLLVHPTEQANYLLDAPNYQNLYCRISMGDDKSIYSGQTTAPAFTAYGSTGGSPTVDVTVLHAMEPTSQFRGFTPGLYSRYYKDSISAALTSSNPQVRISDINRGGRMRAIVLKTGVIATGTSSGNVAYASLSDDILQKIQIQRGSNTTVWEMKDFLTARQNASIISGFPPQTGFLQADWVRSGNFAELFDASGIVAGPTGDVDFFMRADVTGAANQQATLLFEEVVVPPSFLRPAA